MKNTYQVRISHASGSREYLVDASTYAVACNRAVSFDDRIAGGNMDETIVIVARRVPPPPVPLRNAEVRQVGPEIRIRGTDSRLGSTGTGFAG